jgi:thiosulfate/3-mercaptopyruvate sulfurtransferase
VVDVRSRVKSFVTEPEFETDPKTGKKILSEVGGHIAGSRLIDMKTMRTDRIINGATVKYMIPARADFEKAVQAAGIEAGKPIVLVALGSEVSDFDALRVYWQLKVRRRRGRGSRRRHGRTADRGRAYRIDAASRAPNLDRESDRSERYFAGSDDVAKAIESRSAALVDS